MCDKSAIIGVAGAVALGVATYAVFDKNAASQECIAPPNHDKHNDFIYPVSASIIVGLAMCALMTLGRLMQADMVQDGTKFAVSLNLFAAGLILPPLVNGVYNYIKTNAECNKTWDLVYVLMLIVGFVSLVLLRLL